MTPGATPAARAFAVAVDVDAKALVAVRRVGEVHDPVGVGELVDVGTRLAPGGEDAGEDQGDGEGQAGGGAGHAREAAASRSKWCRSGRLAASYTAKGAAYSAEFRYLLAVRRGDLVDPAHRRDRRVPGAPPVAGPAGLGWGMGGGAGSGGAPARRRRASRRPRPTPSGPWPCATRRTLMGAARRPGDVPACDARRSRVAGGRRRGWWRGCRGGRARWSRCSGATWRRRRGPSRRTPRGRRSTRCGSSTRVPSGTPCAPRPWPTRATRSAERRAASVGDSSADDRAQPGGQNTVGSACRCQSDSQSISAATVMCTRNPW